MSVEETRKKYREHFGTSGVTNALLFFPTQQNAKTKHVIQLPSEEDKTEI